MEESPSWEVGTRSAGEEIPALMEPEYSLPHSQELATKSYPVPYESVHALKPYFFNIHYSIMLGRVIAQAVSRRPLTPAARVPPQGQVMWDL
jgi:hypothetical protein